MLELLIKRDRQIGTDQVPLKCKNYKTVRLLLATLQALINAFIVTFDGRPLGFEAALKLVKVFDKDRNGRVDFFEYASMHKFITRVRYVLNRTQTSSSGSFNY
jgi:hypothetical protein